MILVFTFVHLIVSAIEREQFIIDYNVGDVEYKDITVLHCKAHNHFQHYYALVDSDTAVVISLRSQLADTMVGKTIKKVPLRQLHSYNIPFWAAETNNLNIGYFSKFLLSESFPALEFMAQRDISQINATRPILDPSPR